MASVSRETISNLHDKIKVVLQKQDYLPLYEKDVKSLGKKASIPGFRKGMVPSGVIKKMYGKEIYAEAVTKLAEKELSTYITDEKLNLLGQPLFAGDTADVPKLDVQNPQDYEFQFEVGLRPEVEVTLPKDAKAILYKVKVKPEDIDNRIDGFQAQFGELKDAETVDGPESIVYGEFTEMNEDGSLKEEGFKGDTSLYVKVFRDEFQEQLKGKKKDDVLTGTLQSMVDSEKYPGVYQNLKIEPGQPIAGAPMQFRITSVNTLEKAPLNEDLYKKAFPSKEITTEEEFRKAVEEDEQALWDNSANNFLEHHLFHLLSEIPVQLPDDFLRKTFAADAPSADLSEEEKEKSYKTFADQLKWSMISEKIITDQQLRVTNEELREDVMEELKKYFGNRDFQSDSEWIHNFADRVLADQKQTDQRIDKLMSRKIFDWVKTQVAVQEKEISQEDFQKELEQHHHHH